MLNFYYWYALVWMSILIIYSFQWSDINTQLDVSLKIFFIITIISSLLLGRIMRRLFRFQPMRKRPQNAVLLSFLAILYFCFEFYLYGSIPLIEYLFIHQKEYTSFTGIKTLHTIVFTFTSYYAILLFYAHVSFCRYTKIYLCLSIALLAILFANGNRGIIMMNIFAFVLIYLSSRQVSFYRCLYYVIPLLLIMLYSFGVLGNLRSGASLYWDDSYITMLGEYNSNYPAYLSGAYKWAYSYLTSPLNNLNYNISNNVWGIGNFLTAFMPDFLTRRIFTENNLSLYVNLVREYFNVSTGYIQALIFGGFLGLFIMYFFVMFVPIFILKYLGRCSARYIPSLAIINIIVIFFFFVNTFAYSGISFQLFFPVAHTMLCKIKNYKKQQE